MNNLNKTIAEKVRGDFPIFSHKISNEKKLIYLDHAATSQKPKQVINALQDYYYNFNANVHRGAHQLSVKATEAFEEARNTTAKFIKAKSSKEIVFTRNATEAINLIARTWGDQFLKKEDEILLTVMEHHSNLVPWQQLAERTGCKIQYIGITPNGELDLHDLSLKLNSHTKLVSLVHISNTLGCCNPIEEIADLAHKFGALVCIDACQSLAHKSIDVASLGIDFLAGSSHKICGPTGVGFLWSRIEILENMQPFLGGGEMIEEVFLDKSSWAELPHKFEAGTPAIAEAIGMATAINYLESIGLNEISIWEQELIEHLDEGLRRINGLQVLGPNAQEQPNKGALSTFNVTDLHSNDISELLDTNGICIRSGHHCCQPLHRHYSLKSTARASLSFTTTHEEINSFLDELNSAISFLREHN